MKTFIQFVESKGEEGAWLMDEKNWINSAINPDHKGFCTPITKKTCTPKRKALAMRFKKGGDLHHDKKDKKD